LISHIDEMYSDAEYDAREELLEKMQK